MNILHPDGHLIAAMFLAPTTAFWLAGMVNGHLTSKARKQAQIDWDLL